MVVAEKINQVFTPKSESTLSGSKKKFNNNITKNNDLNFKFCISTKETVTIECNMMAANKCYFLIAKRKFC